MKDGRKESDGWVWLAVSNGLKMEVESPVRGIADIWTSIFPE